MRVTIDLDYDDPEYAKGLLERLRQMFGNAYIRKTRRGYHLKSYTSLGLDEALEVRKMLGDDPVRVRLDRMRLKKPKQILWTWKEGFKNGEWREGLDEEGC